jgi:hypothetical protein
MTKSVVRLSILLILVVLPLVTLAQISSADSVDSAGPQLQWSQTYLGLGGQAIQTSDGGYVIAGTNASVLFYPASERAPILIKTDPSGAVQWTKTFETGNAGVNSVIQTSDGGFAISGSNIIAPPVFNPTYSGWLIKLDNQGNLQWNKTFDSLQRCCVIQVRDNGYVVVGIKSNNVSSVDVVLLKTDVNGNVLWDKTQTFNGEAPHPFLMDIVETAGSNYAAAGTFSKEFWLIEVDSNGTSLWKKTYNPLQSDKNLSFQSISNTNDGGFILAGMGGGGASLQNNNIVTQEGNYAWLVKVNSKGDLEWSHNYASSITGFSSAIEAKNGGYVAVGSYDKQTLVVRTDASGDLLYRVCYGDKAENNSSYASAVILTSDGGFAVSGALNNYTPTSADGFKITPFVGNNVWLAKFAQESNVFQEDDSENTFPSVTVTIAVIVIVAVIIGLLLVYVKFRPKPTIESLSKEPSNLS